MKRVLIVEPDRQVATRLFQILTDSGDYTVSSVETAREASLLLNQQPHDVAFIPLQEDQSLLRSLRRLQPDLRLVALPKKEQQPLPESYRGLVQGTLPRSEIRRDSVYELLEEVLAASLSPPVPPVAESEQDGTPASLSVALHTISLEDKVLTVLISRGQQLLAHTGTLTNDQASLIAEQVATNWQPGNSAQIQFARLPSRTSDLLLFTRSVADDLLTLAAQSDTAIGQVRHQAEAVLEEVAPFLGGITAPGQPGRVAVPVPSRKRPAINSFAVIWGTRRALPDGLHKPLAEIVRGLAESHSCTLSFIDITSSFVHLVVTCPSSRNSAWVASMFKRESETALQEHFAWEPGLWAPGYYATTSTEPLSQAELNLFLHQQTDHS